MAINKAKKLTGSNPPGQNDYRAFHRIADEIAEVFEGKILTTLEEFRERVDFRELLRVVADGGQRDIESVIPWNELLNSNEDLRDDLQEALERAGVTSNEQLKALLKRSGAQVESFASFNGSDPRVERWARSRSSILVTDITHQSRQAVRNAIGDLVSGDSNPLDVAKRIQDAVGLTERQSNAVNRFRQSMSDAGLDADTVDRRTEGYRDRLMRQRAETISRTETINAVNAGQQEAWDQAAEDGVVDRKTAKKMWIVTPDDRLCPICEPLGGVTVGIDEQFDTEEGLVDGPGLHPNCRCSMAIVLE